MKKYFPLALDQYADGKKIEMPFYYFSYPFINYLSIISINNN